MFASSHLCDRRELTAIHNGPRQVRGCKHQRERNPCSEQAGKHLKISENQEGHNENVHQDRKGDENRGSLHRRGVVKLGEVEPRDRSHEDRGADRVDSVTQVFYKLTSHLGGTQTGQIGGICIVASRRRIIA